MSPESDKPATALELSHALRARETTVTALVEQSLERIAADRRAAVPIDAWATVEQAEVLRTRAAELDAALARAEPLHPLAGIPFGVKDLLDTSDLPTEAGSARWRGRRPTTDATAVRHTREARALMIGKTRTHEFAGGVTTPPTGNPFDTTRTPGGSSGGSAAAVAAGQCAWAIGTDTLGSVRMPAALCGVVGLKPTQELVSRQGVAVLSTSLDHVGVLTLDCADAAATLDLLSGPARPPRLPAVPQDLPLMLGVLDVGADTGTDADIEPGVAAAYAAAGEQLAAVTGAATRTVRLRPGSEYVAIGFDVLAFEAADWHAPLLATDVDPGHDYGPDVRALLEYGVRLGEDAYHRALRQMATVRSEAQRLFADIDVLILPAVPFAAPLRSRTEYRWPSGRLAPLAEDMPRFTAFGDLTGLPAVTVPVGRSGGLPVAVQLVGRRNTDHRLLALGALIQERIAPTQPATSDSSLAATSPAAR